MAGATDWNECKTRLMKASPCRCLPVCAICGYGKHDALHGPFLDQPPGSEPYDHEYKPKADLTGEKG